MPKITVIIACYNVEKYLNKCLDSVINQTLLDIEIICINDGSTDNTGNILEEYALKDSRIKVFYQKNCGYGKAMNVGLENANGDYIGIVEPDDYVDIYMYEDLYRIATENDSDIVKSAFYKNIDSPNKKAISINSFDNYEILPKRTFGSEKAASFLAQHPSIWSCIYKRTLIYDNNIKFVEAKGAGWVDNLFQVQTICLAKRVNYTANAYYYWRMYREEILNYKIPFERSFEIHEWLNKYNITEENILVHIYKRELYYIDFVLKQDQISNMFDCLKNIQLLCRKMNPDIVLNNSKVLKKEKLLFLEGYNHPLMLYIKMRIKHYRQKIIRFGDGNKILLFGKIRLN